MADVNTVVIVGRLTRDLNPADEREFAYTPGGTARANVSVAVNTRQKNGEQWIDVANYINVTIFGKSAENLKPYLTRGKQIAVEGSLRQDRWTDKETGRQRDRLYVVADNVQLLGGGAGAPRSGGQPMAGGMGGAPQQNQGYQQGGYAPQPQQPSYQQQYQPNPSGDSGFGGGMSDFPDEVPF